MDRDELLDEDGRLRVGVGDEIEATVVSTGDEVRLSYKLRQGAQARQALAMAAEPGVPVEGKVAAVIKGGYEATVAGLRAFCPFSQMDLRRADAPEECVGRVLDFRSPRTAGAGETSSCPAERGMVVDLSPILLARSVHATGPSQ